jgi:hypothetical protein
MQVSEEYKGDRTRRSRDVEIPKPTTFCVPMRSYSSPAKALNNVTSRHSCFPSDGYAEVSSNETENILRKVPISSHSPVVTSK